MTDSAAALNDAVPPPPSGADAKGGSSMAVEVLSDPSAEAVLLSRAGDAPGLVQAQVVGDEIIFGSADNGQSGLATDPEPLSLELVSEVADEIETALNYKEFVFIDNPDEERIINLLASLSRQDRQNLRLEWKAEHDGKSIEQSFSEKLGEGVDYLRMEAILESFDGTTNISGAARVAIEMAKTDRRGITLLREILLPLNSDQMRGVSMEFEARYQGSLDSYLAELYPDDSGASVRESIQILELGSDARTASDVLRLVDLAIQDKDKQLLSQSLRGESASAAEARKALMENPAKLYELFQAFPAVNDPLAPHWLTERERVIALIGLAAGANVDPLAESLDANEVLRASEEALKGRQFDPAVNERLMHLLEPEVFDYLTLGQVSLATLADESNVQLWFDTKDLMELATENATMDERRMFARGEEPRASRQEPATDEDKRALLFFDRTAQAFDANGSAEESARWKENLRPSADSLGPAEPIGALFQNVEQGQSSAEILLQARGVFDANPQLMEHFAKGDDSLLTADEKRLKEIIRDSLTSAFGAGYSQQDFIDEKVNRMLTRGKLSPQDELTVGMPMKLVLTDIAALKKEADGLLDGPSKASLLEEYEYGRNSLYPQEKQVLDLLESNGGEMTLLAEVRLAALGHSDPGALKPVLSAMAHSDINNLRDEYFKTFGADLMSDMLAILPEERSSEYVSLMSPDSDGLQMFYDNMREELETQGAIIRGSGDEATMRANQVASALLSEYQTNRQKLPPEAQQLLDAHFNEALKSANATGRIDAFLLELTVSALVAAATMAMAPAGVPLWAAAAISFSLGGGAQVAVKEAIKPDGEVMGNPNEMAKQFVYGGVLNGLLNLGGYQLFGKVEDGIRLAESTATREIVPLAAPVNEEAISGMTSELMGRALSEGRFAVTEEEVRAVAAQRNLTTDPLLDKAIKDAVDRGLVNVQDVVASTAAEAEESARAAALGTGSVTGPVQEAVSAAQSLEAAASVTRSIEDAERLFAPGRAIGTTMKAEFRVAPADDVIQNGIRIIPPEGGAAGEQWVMRLTDENGMVDLFMGDVRQYSVRFAGPPPADIARQLEGSVSYVSLDTPLTITTPDGVMIGKPGDRLYRFKNGAESTYAIVSGDSWRLPEELQRTIIPGLNDGKPPMTFQTSMGKKIFEDEAATSYVLPGDYVGHVYHGDLNVDELAAYYRELDAMGIRVPKILEIRRTETGEAMVVTEQLARDDLKHLISSGQLNAAQMQAVKTQLYEMARILEQNRRYVRLSLKNLAIDGNGNLVIAGPIETSGTSWTWQQWEEYINWLISNEP